MAAGSHEKYRFWPSLRVKDLEKKMHPENCLSFSSLPPESHALFPSTKPCRAVISLVAFCLILPAFLSCNEQIHMYFLMLLLSDVKKSKRSIVFGALLSTFNRKSLKIPSYWLWEGLSHAFFPRCRVLHHVCSASVFHEDLQVVSRSLKWQMIMQWITLCIPVFVLLET